MEREHLAVEEAGVEPALFPEKLPKALYNNHLQFLDNLTVKGIALLYDNQLQFIDLLENLTVKGPLLQESFQLRQKVPPTLLVRPQEREVAVQFSLTCWMSWQEHCLVTEMLASPVESGAGHAIV